MRYSMFAHLETATSAGAPRADLGRGRAGVGRLALFSAVVLLGAQDRASAAFLVGTVGEGRRIFTADTTTSVQSTVTTLPNTPDGLIFDTSNRIIYLDQGDGQVRRFDPVTRTDTVLASGFSRLADIAMEPGNASILVTESGAGKIDRISLATNVVTTLVNRPQDANIGPNGIIYDTAGRLFGNLGNRETTNGSFVARIDPVTGAILQQSVSLNGLDGLTYDSFTGRLYAASAHSSSIFSIDPNTLLVTSLLATLPNSAAADGIVSDGAGNLFIAGRDSVLYQYTFANNSLRPTVTIPDGTSIDLAPLSGLGAAVPEPSSLLMSGLSASILLVDYGRRRRRAANL